MKLMCYNETTKDKGDCVMATWNEYDIYYKVGNSDVFFGTVYDEGTAIDYAKPMHGWFVKREACACYPIDYGMDVDREFWD